MANDIKNDPNSYYPRYATDKCTDCNDIYYSDWGKVKVNNHELFIPYNTVVSQCRSEQGNYPFRY